MTPAVFSVITKDHLAYARVAFGTLAEHHPNWHRVLFLADRVDGCFDPAGEPFDVVECEELGLPDLDERLERYAPFEFLSSLQAVCAAWLAGRGHPAVLRIDVDLLFLAPIPEVAAALTGESSVVLTPHLLAPLTGDWTEERKLLQFGVFNWGFGGVNLLSAEGQAFQRWWEARSRLDCFDDPSRGLYLNQKWMDLVPAFFPRTTVLRDPGLNVAWWNLAERSVRLDGTEWTCNGQPLRFFHFSGVRIEERVFSRWAPAPDGDVRRLFHEYVDRVEAAGYAEARSWPNAYAARFGRDARVPPPRAPRGASAALRRAARLLRRR